MKILVIYFKWKRHKDRNTIDEHLYSFRKYVEGCQFHYFNAANGIPCYLTWLKYDGVILHYTFFAIRWRKEIYKIWLESIKKLNNISGYFVAIPQDEYAEIEEIWKLFNQLNVMTVFTCFSPEDFETAYPKKKVNLKHRISVFAGYIDENAVQELDSGYLKNSERAIDVGYRARRVPYWLGRHGQYKHEIGEIFLENAQSRELKINISTGEGDVLIGGEWYEFLKKCRTFLGCEGGASLFDSNGDIRYKVEEYLKINPTASFRDAEKKCFSGMDYNISLFTISPRHFECVITRTCQVLLEGRYNGVLTPWKHYIELKKDFSNIDEVIKKICDKGYCQNMAESAYRDIVESGKYTYGKFSREVVNHIKENRKNKNNMKDREELFRVIGVFLRFREFLEPILVKIFYAWFGVKVLKKRIKNKIKTLRGIARY